MVLRDQDEAEDCTGEKDDREDVVMPGEGEDAHHQNAAHQVGHALSDQPDAEMGSGGGVRQGRKHTSHTVSQQASAVLHYVVTLEGKHRDLLYNWYFKTYGKELKANTFTKWLQKKDEILARAESVGNGNRGEKSRLREGVAAPLNRALIKWWEEMHDRMHITDEVLLQQARAIVDNMPEGDTKTQLLNPKVFNFSANWLLTFKKAYGLTQAAMNKRNKPAAEAMQHTELWSMPLALPSKQRAENRKEELDAWLRDNELYEDATAPLSAYGVRSLQDLEDLDAEDFKELSRSLPPLKVKQLRRRILALAKQVDRRAARRIKGQVGAKRGSVAAEGPSGKKAAVDKEPGGYIENSGLNFNQINAVHPGQMRSIPADSLHRFQGQGLAPQGMATVFGGGGSMMGGMGGQGSRSPSHSHSPVRGLQDSANFSRPGLVGHGFAQPNLLTSSVPGTPGFW